MQPLQTVFRAEYRAVEHPHLPIASRVIVGNPGFQVLPQAGVEPVALRANVGHFERLFLRRRAEAGANGKNSGPCAPGHTRWTCNRPVPPAPTSGGRGRNPPVVWGGRGWPGNIENPVADPDGIIQVVAVADRVRGVVEHPQRMGKAGPLGFAGEQSPLARLHLRRDERPLEVQRPDVPDHFRDFDLLMLLGVVADEMGNLVFAFRRLKQVPAECQHDAQRQDDQADCRRFLRAATSVGVESAEEL